MKGADFWVLTKDGDKWKLGDYYGTGEPLHNALHGSWGIGLHNATDELICVILLEQLAGPCSKRRQSAPLLPKPSLSPLKPC